MTDPNEQVNRDFKGVWIPREIWLDTSLSLLEKVLFAEIHSLDGPDGCYASNEYFCKFLQCRERNLQLAMASLKNRGYIFIANFDGRTRVIKTCMKTIYEKLCTSAPQEVRDGEQKVNKTEKERPINTSPCGAEVQKIAPLGCKKLHPPSRAFQYTEIKEEIKANDINEVNSCTSDFGEVTEVIAPSASLPSLAFQSEKKENNKSPATSKWAKSLSADQRKTYEWLKTQDLGADDDTLCHLARQYPLEGLKSARQEAIEYGASTTIAYMRKLLSEGRQMRNSRTEENRAYGEYFVMSRNLPWEIQKLYVVASFPNGSIKEIRLDQEMSAFADQLERLKETFENYQ